MTDRSERRVRLDLAYDGTRFAGWQVQPGALTVQGTVEDALGRIAGGEPIRIRGASRTDAGVHARQQVADARVGTRLDDADLLRALASVLPEDVRPRSVATVDDGFHSRHLAESKTYQFLLDRSRLGDPFLARVALHHPHVMNLERLQAALQRLPGRRDWAGFAGAAGDTRSTVRDLTEARYAETPEGLGVFSFTADGFLNHMVRNVVGTLLEVARGRFQAARVDEVLASGDRRRAGPTAPARGLCLVRVAYPGDPPSDGDARPWIHRPALL